MFYKYNVGTYDPFKESVLINILKRRGHVGNSQPHKGQDADYFRSVYNNLLKSDKEAIYNEFWESPGMIK